MEDFDLEETNRLLDQILAEKEAAEKYRIHYDVPEQWHWRYYLRHGYLLKLGKQKSLHFSGADGKAPKCPECHKRLDLLLDVDCAAACFRKEQVPAFNGLLRLPLHYCFQCAGATTYRVLKNRVQLLPEECSREESAFEANFVRIPRVPVVLKPIDRGIEDLLALAQHVTPEWLSRTQQREVMQYLGKEGSHFFDLERSQFGGLPHFVQGYRDYACRNSRCKTHRMGSQFISHGFKFQMKALASIGYDFHGVPGGKFTQVIFQMCFYCNTVTAECDST